MATPKKRKARDANGRRTHEDWLDAEGKPRWDAQVYLGRQGGRPRFSMRSFKTEKAAKAWVRAQESDKEQNLAPMTATRETLGEYLKRWLPVYAETVRDVTAYNIDKTLTRWIIKPRDTDPDLMIGVKRLDKLTADHFDRLYLALRRQKGMKPGGIRHLHAAMKQALKAAVRKRVLPRNPMDGVTLPKDNAKGDVDVETTVRYLTHERTKRFLTAAKEDRLSALWHLLVYTGMRPCEALALRWSNKDVDLDEGRCPRARHPYAPWLGQEGREVESDVAQDQAGAPNPQAVRCTR